MPPKKNQLNGFWLFAQTNKSRWKAQGLRVGTNNELLSIANPLWKSMDPAQKKDWDKQAKDQRKKGDGGDAVRYDNVGNVIGMRQNPAEEARKRRERDINLITSKWLGKDLTQERFYFINFQELVELTHSDNTEERKFLPREMAMMEYSLTHGIIQFYHQFIWPGDIPLGFRFQAEQIAEEVHKIPAAKMNEDWDSEDYPRIWQKMLQLVQAGVKDGVYPPLFCLTQDYDKMKYLTDWMWAHSGDLGDDNPLHWVCSTEDLVVALLAASGKPGTENVVRAQVTAGLDGSQWEFIPTTTCDFHKEKDVSRHCALAVVRRTAYTISDMVGMHYGITLSERHVPVRQEDDASNTGRVLPPGAVPLFNSKRPPRRGGARGGGRAWNKREDGERARSREGGNTYSKIRPRTDPEGYGLLGAQQEEEEEYVGQYLSQPRVMQPADNKLRSSQSVMMQYHNESPGFAQPKPGQFEDPDWPSLGGPGASHSDSAAKQMSDMTLADASSALLTDRATSREAFPSPLGVNPPPGFGGVGRGAAWGIQPQPSNPAPSTQQALPPRGKGAAPQYGGGAFSPSRPLAVGRGERPGSGRGEMPPPVGRGSMPTVGRGEMLAAGRGNAPPPVGRGQMPPGDRGGSHPSVGRGDMPAVGRGTYMPSASRQEMAGVGRGDTAGVGSAEMAGAGRAGPPVGRGQMPTGSRGGASLSVGGGEMPASGSSGVPAVGRGWSPAGNSGDAASNSGRPSPAPSAMPLSWSPQQPSGVMESFESAAAFNDDFPALGMGVGRGLSPGRGRGVPVAGTDFSPS